MKWLITALMLTTVVVMAGSYTVPVTGLAYQPKAFDNELVTVANEIYEAVTPAAAFPHEDENVAGEHASTASGALADRWTLKEMQNLVEDSYQSFMPMTNVIEGMTNEVIPTSAKQYTNWVQFALAAGISTNGWRRATTDPADWTNLEDAEFVAAGYGQITAGDIRGAWIEDDLQKAFDAMRWMYTYNVTWDLDGTYSNYWLVASGQSNSWAEARTGAAFPDPAPQYVDGATPQCSYYGLYQIGIPYAATTRSFENNARLENDAFTNIATTVLYFQRATYDFGRVTDVWDSNGMDVLKEQWHQFGTATVGDKTTNVLYSATLGAKETEPNECDEPGTSPNPDSHEQGWRASAPVAIQQFEWSYTRP